jgi:hypothetical protein
MPGDGPSGRMSEFELYIRVRMFELACEWAKRVKDSGGRAIDWDHFVMPIGLLLVVDDNNGGDVTAQELIKRFHLLDSESADIIDFYFMGWHWIYPGDRSKGIRFDLSTFRECREALKKVGIKAFGGNADLILVDACYWCPKRGFRSPDTFRSGEISLDFSQAIHINLTSRLKDADIPPVGELLQTIIDAAESVRTAHGQLSCDGNVFAISDRLGLASAKRSFLTFVLEKFGAIIGARKLEALTVRNLGPVVGLEQLALDGIASERAR